MSFHSSELSLGRMYLRKRPARISLCINHFSGYGFTLFDIRPVVAFIHFFQIFADSFFFLFVSPQPFHLLS